MAPLEERLKQQAHALGFDLVGIARATEADSFDRLEAWLSNDFAGEMDYMRRHAQARRHPDSVLPGVQSVVMVGMNYFFTEERVASSEALGQVARYARGLDYHDVLRARLRKLLDWLQIQCRDAVAAGW